MTDELAIVAKLMRFGPAYTTGHPDAPGGMTTLLPRINPDGPEAAAIIEGLVEALEFAKRRATPLLDQGEDAIWRRAANIIEGIDAALAKVRTPHHPDEGGRA